MFRAQLSLMLHKKSFQFSFLLMLCISALYPAFCFLFLLLKDHVTLNDDLVSAISWIHNPSLFYYGNSFTPYLCYFIPIIVLFPFSISYIVENKYNYNSVCISRGGKRSYLMTKAVCSMLGGFLIFLIPSCINLLWNCLIMPECFDFYSKDAYYLMHYQMNLGLNPYYISSFSFWAFCHPVLDALLSCFSVSLFAAVCALIVYTISLNVKKFAYLSSFPLVVFLLALQKTEYSGILSDSFIGAVDPISFVCVGCDERQHPGFYLLFLAICTAVCFLIIHNKSKKDLV